MANLLPASIQQALAIDPAPGSTWQDAEHIVFLMQENRSFDHCYGALQGVRGFNDPRAIQLPDNDPVWMQKNANGDTYAPFRLDMKNTRATWMGDLPHSWNDQLLARNNGRYDKWLVAKTLGGRDRDFPMTMGYYNREDIPFYYALADAFTVCDQHFCSSLTGTTPNRLFFWSGKIREDERAKARVHNSDTDYNDEAAWTTYPERLEDNGVSWKVYQNEISVGVGFDGEEDSWLANFTDNPLEWFSQYHVKLSEGYLRYLETAPAKTEAAIAALEQQLADPAAINRGALQKQLQQLQQELAHLREEAKTYTRQRYEALPQREKNLHNKAFSTNRNDPHYHELTTLQYEEGGKPVELKVPKGDILHQFRQDVQSGQLPTVSWIVAPQKFSDHPSSPWYGAWYLSEVFDILTTNPEVWKKTIFVLTYDENDGYFDHVPPFVAPDPERPATGKVSTGIDTRTEISDGHPVGLGYRVPMVIASPWSRGGWVNSEVFDHTSCLQFLERFLKKKTGKDIRETNISSWRRAVCGDLVSVFRPYNGEALELPTTLEKDSFIRTIYNARFKGMPTSHLGRISLPVQEPGTRHSCALPYQLYADGQLSPSKETLELRFAAGRELFGQEARGSAFTVYAPGHPQHCRSYAVTAGNELTDQWDLQDFGGRDYHFRIYGPNGFFRELRGNALDPAIRVVLEYERVKGNPKAFTGNLLLSFSSRDKKEYHLDIEDKSYGTAMRSIKVDRSGRSVPVLVKLDASSGWYDLSVKVRGAGSFEKRYAGRVETGRHSISDPLMGKKV